MISLIIGFELFDEDCGTIVHVIKIGCLCGHVFGRSKSMAVKCASKQALVSIIGKHISSAEG